MTIRDIRAAHTVTTACSGTLPDRTTQNESVDTNARNAALLTTADERSLAQLLTVYGRVVYNLAFAIGRDHEDAEDVVNFTFAKAWRERDRFDATRGPVVAWLSVIGRNRAFDIVRARKRRDHHTIRYGIETHIAAQSYGVEHHHTSDAELRMERTEVSAALHTALAALPSAQREVIELAYLGDCSHTDVAARLGVPLGTVKTRARMALRRMRSTIDMATVRL